MGSRKAFATNRNADRSNVRSLGRATTRDGKRLSMVVVAPHWRGNGGAIGFKNRPANTTWSKFARLEGSSRVDKSSVVKRNAASVAGEKKQEKKTRLRPTGKRVEWTAGGRRARVRQRRLNSVKLWHAAKGTRTEIPCKYDSSPSPSSFLQATGVALFPLFVAKPSSEDEREKGEKQRLSRVDEWRVR